MNVVSVTGNLTKDPEMGQNDTGQEVCRLRLGLGRGRHSETVYTDVKVFGTEARRCARYLARGRSVAVSGWLEFAEWVGRDGIKRSRLYVGTTNVDFMGPVGGSVVADSDAEGPGVAAIGPRDLDAVEDGERLEDFDDQEAVGIIEDAIPAPEQELAMLSGLPDLDEEQVEADVDLQLHS
jgi:single-strand DNA-binding protein